MLIIYMQISFIEFVVLFIKYGVIAALASISVWYPVKASRA